MRYQEPQPPPKPPTPNDLHLQHLAEIFMITALTNLPVSDKRLDTYHKAQLEDPQC